MTAASRAQLAAKLQRAAFAQRAELSMLTRVVNGLARVAQVILTEKGAFRPHRALHDCVDDAGWRQPHDDVAGARPRRDTQTHRARFYRLPGHAILWFWDFAI